MYRYKSAKVEYDKWARVFIETCDSDCFSKETNGVYLRQLETLVTVILVENAVKMSGSPFLGSTDLI